MFGTQAMVFSRRPYGALWVCASCDRVHARFGNCILMFPPEVLGCWTDVDAVTAAICEDCRSLHLVCENGHMDIPGEHLVDFFKAAAALHERLRFPAPTPGKSEALIGRRH